MDLILWEDIRWNKCTIATLTTRTFPKTFDSSSNFLTDTIKIRISFGHIQMLRRNVSDDEWLHISFTWLSSGNLIDNKPQGMRSWPPESYYSYFSSSFTSRYIILANYCTWNKVFCQRTLLREFLFFCVTI